ncbi:MAG: hypothetical protein HQ581_11845 [Planctomycetes bacterium]|nr:hypothetical protein [Planctomycetota bacterium]
MADFETLERIYDRLVEEHDRADEVDEDYYSPWMEAVAIRDVIEEVKQLRAKCSERQTRDQAQGAGHGEADLASADRQIH